MKKSLLVLSAAFVLSLSSASAFAQNCTGVISDEANALNPSDTRVVESQASQLVDQGIMPHVIIVQNLAKYGVRLADVESAYEKKCPNWLGANHQRVGNLLVLIVAPSARLKNAFFGAALAPAFGGQSDVDALFSQAANPYFKGGQYAGGMAAAMKDFSAKNMAYHNQAKNPVQSTTIINQAPKDTASSSHAVEWVFGLLFLAGLIVLVIWWFMRRSASKEETEAAQQAAQAAEQKATNLFRNADSSSPGYADVAAQYTTLSNSVTYDPNSSGLSAAAYGTMAAAWSDLANDIRSLRRPAPTTTASTTMVVEDPTPAPKAAAAAAGVDSSSRFSEPAVVVHHHYHDYEPAPVQQSTVIHETTVVHDNSGDMLTGVLVGEALANNDRDRYREEPDYSSPSSGSEGERDEPSHEESSGSDSSWSSSSSSDDDSSSSSSSGSDSSWSDSSSSDSSSSFDSSSSDSSSSGSDSSW